jgi:hypothetical protein
VAAGHQRNRASSRIKRLRLSGSCGGLRFQIVTASTLCGCRPAVARESEMATVTLQGQLPPQVKNSSGISLVSVARSHSTS